MQLGNGVLRQLPQFRCELDLAAAFAGGVKDSTAVNHDAEHFFETEGLGAELRVVVLKLAAFAFLVFDRAKPIRISEFGFRTCVKPDLDNVAFSGQAKPFRPDG